MDYTENSDSYGLAYSHNIITNYYGSGNWSINSPLFSLNNDNTITVGFSTEPNIVGGVHLRTNLSNRRYVVFVIFDV